MASIFDYVDEDIAKKYAETNKEAILKRSCELCKLYTWPKSPKMKPTIPKKNMQGLLIGEEPGEHEDEYGTHFYKNAPSGSYLRDSFRRVGLNPLSWAMENAIACRKQNNTAPTDQELTFCKDRLLKVIKKLQPKHIIIFGNSPLTSLFSTSGIQKFRGRIMPSHELHAWVYPMLHPTAVLHDRGDKEEGKLDPIFLDDLKRIRRHIKANINVPKVKPYNIIQLRNYEDVQNFLTYKIMNEKIFCYDFETVGLRPYPKEAKIVSVAMSFDGNTSYSFPIEKSGEFLPKQSRRIIELLKVPLENNKIVKVVQNLNMEYEWSAVRLGTYVKGVIEDTQRMAFIFDERHKCHSLAFMTLCNFGVVWKDMVHKYIKNMDECPTELCLEYNGMDSIWTFRNYELYKTKLNKKENSKLNYVYKELMIKGAIAATKIQINGAVVDIDKIENLSFDFTKQKNKAVNKINNLKEIKDFEKAKHRRFNFNSDDQVRDFLFTFSNIESLKKTRKGRGEKEAVDESVLTSLAKKGNDFCKNLLKFREYNTLITTFIEGVKDKVWPDGKFHTTINNTFTRTGRPSSDHPNMYNFPKRKHSEVRDVVTAPEGYVIVCADYDQVEAVCLGIESGDKNFKAALMDKYDIHYDYACKIYGKDKVDKDMQSKKPSLRQNSKNGFVFPTFYGAGAGSVARQLGVDKDFAIQLQEDLFKDFPRIREWQLEIVDFYNKHLYIESRLGRRRYGPLERNKLFNSIPQGLASDFCTKAMIRLVSRSYWVWLNLYDELGFYIKEGKSLFSHLIRIKRGMETMPTEWVDDVHLTVGLKIGKSWGSLEKVDLHDF